MAFDDNINPNNVNTAGHLASHARKARDPVLAVLATPFSKSQYLFSSSSGDSECPIFVTDLKRRTRTDASPLMYSAAINHQALC